MFKETYSFFSIELACTTVWASRYFKLEKDVYDYFKPMSQKMGWKYDRIDTTGQMGFPDILLTKQTTYWKIEAKVLKKTALNHIGDDLKWQPGQLAYALKSFMRKDNYMIMVGKDDRLAFLHLPQHNTEEFCNVQPISHANNFGSV